MYLGKIDSFTGENKWLSNYHMCEIEYDGLVYPSTEHAYQAAKTHNQVHKIRIANMPKPGEAKGAGMIVEVRNDWDTHRLVVMEDVLRIKFKDPELRKKLFMTTGYELIEGNTHGDRFWGTVNGEGENHLGKILMKIRAEILTEEFVDS